TGGRPLPAARNRFPTDLRRARRRHPPGRRNSTRSCRIRTKPIHSQERWQAAPRSSLRPPRIAGVGTGFSREPTAVLRSLGNTALLLQQLSQPPHIAGFPARTQQLRAWERGDAVRPRLPLAADFRPLLGALERWLCLEPSGLPDIEPAGANSWQVQVAVRRGAATRRPTFAGGPRVPPIAPTIRFHPPLEGPRPTSKQAHTAERQHAVPKQWRCAAHPLPPRASATCRGPPRFSSSARPCDRGRPFAEHRLCSPLRQRRRLAMDASASGRYGLSSATGRGEAA